MNLFDIDKRTDIAPAPGKILISEPFLNDPRFYRSVILITNHDEEGTLGFVLNNRPSGNPLIMNANTNRPLFSVDTLSQKLSKGGPISLEDFFIIHDAQQALGGFPIFHDICLGMNDHVDFSETYLDEYINFLDSEIQVKYFMGSSGWGFGQLEEEIKMGSWFVGDSNKELIFSTDFDDLWKQAIYSLGKEFEFFTTLPPHPQLN